MSSKPVVSRSKNATDRSKVRAPSAKPVPVAPIAEKSTIADEEMLDAKTAASMLGVKTQTLYAYVSRGLIRTAPRRGTQASLYHREDVETVRLNGRGGSVSTDPGERISRWSGSGGVLQTAITSINASGPRYRGKLAVDLANMRRPFEDCAELLWSGVLPPQSVVWSPPVVPDTFPAFSSAIARIARKPNTRQLLALIAQSYGASIGRNPENVLGAPVLAGRQLIQILAPALGLLRKEPRYLLNSEPEPVASVLARSVGVPRSEEVLRALNVCLVLSADHELAPSTFAARIAASAGADIFACVNNAFGTFDGPLTGFGCDESEKMLRAAVSPKKYVNLLNEFAERKEFIPGYNHPLYPEGDPRALYLLELARVNVQTPKARLILNCIDAGIQETEAVPSLAVGLVAIAAAFDLPEESPGAIMAIGRVAGWIAHAFEQRLAGFLVRPRTRYIGPLE
ncbi:MAG: citrate synthase [Pseudomonadota bacterium]